MIRLLLKGINGDDVRAGSLGVIACEKDVELLRICNGKHDPWVLVLMASCTRATMPSHCCFRIWTSVRFTQ